jgi:hypothetical protein
MNTNSNIFHHNDSVAFCIFAASNIVFCENFEFNDASTLIDFMYGEQDDVQEFQDLEPPPTDEVFGTQLQALTPVMLSTGINPYKIFQSVFGDPRIKMEDEDMIGVCAVWDFKLVLTMLGKLHKSNLIEKFGDIGVIISNHANLNPNNVSEIFLISCPGWSFDDAKENNFDLPFQRLLFSKGFLWNSRIVEWRGV